MQSCKSNSRAVMPTKGRLAQWLEIPIGLVNRILSYGTLKPTKFQSSRSLIVQSNDNFLFNLPRCLPYFRFAAFFHMPALSANRSDRLNISFKFATCLTRVAARRAGHRPNPTVPTLSLQKAKHVPETWFGAKYFVSVYWSNRFIEISQGLFIIFCRISWDSRFGGDTGL